MVEPLRETCQFLRERPQRDISSPDSLRTQGYDRKRIAVRVYRTSTICLLTAVVLLHYFTSVISFDLHKKFWNEVKELWQKIFKRFGVQAFSAFWPVIDIIQGCL